MDTTLSPEQLAERASGITATDVAAIVGVHPYKSAVNVWSEKLGHAAPFDGNDRTKWGNILEPVLRTDYEERKACRVEVHGTMSNRERSWMKATPDGLVYERDDAWPNRGLEIKCHTVHLSYLYGAPGSDEIPQYELCQVGWNMAVTGLKRWDLIAFIDGQPIDYVIDRDDELIELLRIRAERFMRDNVQTKTPPPPDGSKAYETWLRAKHRSDDAIDTMINVGGDPLAMDEIERLRELRDQIADLERQEGIKVQELKARIGAHAGIEWPNGKPAPKKGKNAGVLPCDRITWRYAAGASFTNYRGAFDALQLRAQLLASALGDAADRALTALDKFADAQFENSRATISAHDVKELIEQLATFARDAAKVQPEITASAPHRRFCVPRHWKTTGQAKPE